MPTPAQAQALALLGELEALLDTHRHAGENSRALDRVEMLASEIAAADPYLAEKAMQLRLDARAFFRRQTRRLGAGGAIELHTHMRYQLLRDMRDRINTRSN